MSPVVRYVCAGCGWRWSREVKPASVPIVLDRPFVVAACPGCADETPEAAPQRERRGGRR